MRRDKVEFTETVNANEGHTDCGKTIYYATMERPFPEGTNRAGSALGRSTVGHDDAYVDLRRRVKAATGVNIGPLRDISDADVFLSVHRMMTTPDVDMGDALEELREVHDLLVEQRRQAHEAQEARKASTYHVWIRRTSTESAMVEVTGACSIKDAKDIALNEPNPTTDWDCVNISDSWVTSVTDVNDDEIVDLTK